MELILIALVRRYRFFPTAKFEPLPVIAVTLSSLNGMKLRFEKR
jgi:hypothetical protein